jgi:hypothetical protein
MTIELLDATQILLHRVFTVFFERSEQHKKAPFNRNDVIGKTPLLLLLLSVVVTSLHLPRGQ